jgi:Flp pilus assembly protein TadD
MIATALSACLSCYLLMAAGQLEGGQVEGGWVKGAAAAALELLPDEARQQLTDQELAVAALLESDEDQQALAEGLGELGKLYYVYGFDGLAGKAWTSASAANPGDFRWHYYIGVLDRIGGRLDSAQARFNRALELRPEDLPARIRLGRIELESGRIAAARAVFEGVLQQAPDSGAALAGLGGVAMAERQFTVAISLFEQALASQRDGSVLHYQLGLAYRGLGDLEKARSHLSRNQGVAISMPDPLMEQLVPVVRGAHFRARTGIDALRKGDVDLAIQRLREATELDPENAWIRYNLAVAYQESGRAEEAIEELRVAVELEPSDSRSHFNLGTSLASADDAAGAAHHFGRAHEIDPQDHLAHLELAVAVSRLGDSGRALEELRVLVATAPQFIEARLIMATLLAQLGRVDEALAIAQETLEMDAAEGEWAAASALAARITESSDPAAAERHYRHAIELDPESEEALSGLAMMLGRLQRFDDSAIQFGQLIAVYPERVDYRLGQTMSYLLGERYAAAVTGLEGSMTRFPQDVGLAHVLARLLATCPDDSVRDGDRALLLARRVLEDEPTIEHAETLAMALAELGRFNDAIALQRQVLAQREQAGAAANPEASRSYLALYLDGRGVRAPWGQ